MITPLPTQVACPCGAKEGEVHRIGCPVYLTDPRVIGDFICSHCGGKVKNTLNGKCGVCHYWTERTIPWTS